MNLDLTVLSRGRRASDSQPLLRGHSTATVGQRGAASTTRKPESGSPAHVCGVALSPPAHRHALIALLTCKMERRRPVVVHGVHHSTSGNQEVDEGCLSYRIEGLHMEKEREEAFQSLSVEPEQYFTLLFPGIRDARVPSSA